MTNPASQITRAPDEQRLYDYGFTSRPITPEQRRILLDMTPPVYANVTPFEDAWNSTLASEISRERREGEIL